MINHYLYDSLIYAKDFFKNYSGVKINLYGAHWATEWNNKYALDVVKIATRITKDNWYTKKELWNLIEREINSEDFFDDFTIEEVD